MRGEPKLAWGLLWQLAGCEPGRVSVTAADVAADQGVTDRGGRNCINVLAAEGLIDVIDRPRDRGGRGGNVWLVWVNDPLDVQRARLARGSDGQGVLEFARDDERSPDATAPEYPPAGRVVERQGAEDSPAELPPLAPTATRQAADVAQHPPVDRAETTQLGASAGCAGGEGGDVFVDVPIVANATRTSTSSLNSGKIPRRLGRQSQGATGGCCAATAASTRDAAASDAGPDDLVLIARKAAELERRVPGLYGEIALAVAAAVLNDRLPLSELERAVGRTLSLAARGELREGPAIYFASAMKIQFRQRGIPWPAKGVS